MPDLPLAEIPFALVVERSETAILLMRPDGRLAYMNARARQHLGLKAGEESERPLSDFFPAEVVEATLALGQHVLALNEGTVLDSDLDLKGRRRALRVSAEPLRPPVGDPLILLQATDVTGLRESEESSRSLFEQNPDPCLILDREGLILDVNPATVTILGLPKDALLGQNPASLSPELQPDGRASSLAAAEYLTEAFTGQRQDFEWTHRRGDGRLLCVQVHLSPLSYRGRPVVLATWRDITAARQAEAELQRLYRALEQSPASTVITDLEGTIVYVNQAACLSTGYSREELLGQNPRMLKSGLTDPVEYETLWRRLNNGLAWRGRFHNRRKDGTLYWEAATIVPVADASGRSSAYVAVKEDITERLSAEAELKAAQERAENERLALAELVGDPTVAAGMFPQALHKVCETAARALSLSQTGIWAFSDDEQELLRLSGYNAESGLSSEGGTLLRPELPRYFEALERDRRIVVSDAWVDPRLADLRDSYLKPLGIRSLLDTGIHVEGRLVGVVCFEHQGENRVWNSDEQVFADTVAALVGQLFANRQRRRVQQLLQQSEQRYRLLVESTHEGLWLLDRAQLTTFVNPALAKMLGHEPAELLGTLFPGRLELGTHEYALPHADGREVHTEINVQALKDEQGRAYGTLLLVADLSDRQKAEEARIARQAAEQANEAKSAFLSSMSHEIRTPLNAILGFAQLLAKDPNLSPRSGEYVQTLLESGDHLVRLINDVLDLSKIEARQMTLQVRDFSLSALLNSLRSSFAPAARRKGLVFTLEADPSLPERAAADEAKLRQILTNLLGNAVKFTESGGILARFRAEPLSGSEKAQSGVSRDRLVLVGEIEDTGPGIPLREQDLIFESFQQGESGHRQGGTGLGLAITRSLLQLLGGRIELESQVGVGSLFRFRLPLSSARAAETLPSAVGSAAERLRALPAKSPPTRLLLVDDQADNRELLRRVLEPFSFELREAATGRQAVQTAAQWHPDLILMDLRMPDLDGFEATRQIRQLPEGGDCVILALTASAFDQDEAAAGGQGFDGYLRKPLSFEELYEALADSLGAAEAPETPAGPGPTAHPGASGSGGEDQNATPGPGTPAAGPPLSASEGPRPVRPEDVAALPAVLRQALAEAARRGHMVHLRRLKEDVAVLNEALGAGLDALIRKYDYEELKRLLDDESTGGSHG